MNTIGRRIYYDITIGNVIVNTGERQGSIIPTTIDQDIAAYTALSERNRETFDVLELPYGAFQQDFSVPGVQYRINLETKKLEFSYPDPNEPDAEPVYQAPLSEEVALAKSDAEMALLALADVYEKQIADNASREEDSITSMMGLAEAYELIMQQQAVIDEMNTRLQTLEGVE